MKEIHITDVEAFQSCRRRWDWQSPLRRGLQRASIPEPLFLGQGVHVGLDVYHSGGGNVYAAVTAFRQWVKQRALSIAEYTGPLWDVEREMINDAYRLGAAMLKHYHLWIGSRSNDYDVVSTEHRYKVPLPVPPGALRGVGMAERSRRGIVLVDGQWVMRDVDLAGRFDGILKHKKTGVLYLLEFKTARTLKNVGYVYRQLQGTVYTWAARQLYGEDVRGIVYRVLRKTAPKPPKPLKSGGFSQAKKQVTTFRYFKFWLDVYASKFGLDVRQLYRENKEILTYLHAQDDSFFVERTLHKTPQLLQNAMTIVYNAAVQMIDPRVEIYPQPSWATCNYCPFQDICDLMELGMPYEAEALLDAEYAPRSYWEKGVNDGRTTDKAGA